MYRIVVVAHTSIVIYFFRDTDTDTPGARCTLHLGEKSFYSELWLLDEGRATVQNIHTEKMAEDLNQPDA